MSDQILSTATTAIFELQLPTNEAIRYVARNAGVHPQVAGQALKEVLVGYKHRNRK